MANILVVDDEVGIRELFSEILSDEGYTVTCAANSAEARVAIARCEPDVVLLDIWMPDTDGMSLLKEWASQGPLPCPVIMMSGHANIDMAVEATKFGAYSFLEKPTSMKALTEALRSAIHAKQTAPQPAPAPKVEQEKKNPLVDLIRSKILSTSLYRFGKLAINLNASISLTFWNKSATA